MNDVIEYDDMNGGTGSNVPAIADDNLMRVAEMAEKRIDAVVKIKQMALKVTGARDWTDQGGNPYLQVSGSEKVANLFNISWRLDEPTVDTEPDGHFTYTMRGIFSIPGRSISAEGSRSSKDPFFKKYDWVKETGKPDKKTERPISAIDRRDVRMAALTNLLGNGITRLLGIRNLSYADLEKYAGITKEMIGKVDYKGKAEAKPPLKEPAKKADAPKTAEAPAAENLLVITGAVTGVDAKPGTNSKTNKPYTLYTITIEGDKYLSFDDTHADLARSAEQSGTPVTVSFTVDKWGNKLTTLSVDDKEPGSDG